jgi:Lipocalin-like domain
MKKFTILLICTFFINICINAQTKKTLIIGNWKFEKITMVDSTAIPAEIIEGNKGIVLTFNKNGTCATVKHNYGNTIKLGACKYQISDDGKYLIQEENEMLIMTLSKNELILRASENVIMKFKRL